MILNISVRSIQLNLIIKILTNFRLKIIEHVLSTLKYAQEQRSVPTHFCTVSTVSYQINV
jgi:hypothetical protein